LAKHPDQILINKWVWLESLIYLGWLSAVLCPVWVMETFRTELYLGYIQINYKLKTDLQYCKVGKGIISFSSYMQVYKLVSTAVAMMLMFKAPC